MLKSVMFQGPRGQWPIAYRISRNECVYTAVNRDLSAIKHVEEIIEAICRQEQRTRRSLRFFELNTHLGYASKEDGEFEFDEVVKTGRPGPENEYIWMTADCPTNIIDAFWHFISRSGVEPRQMVCEPVVPIAEASGFVS